MEEERDLDEGRVELGRPLVVFVCGSLVYYHCAYRDSSLLSLVSDVLIVLICSLAILGMLFRQMNISVPVDPLEWQISQDTANGIAACLANTIGATESVLRVAAAGHDKRLFLKVVVTLYLLSAIGRYASGATVAYAGLCLFCLYVFAQSFQLINRCFEKTELFEKAGVVEVAEVIYNRETDQSRGFGFVTMRTVEEAEQAVEMFHRYDVNGRLLTVNKAAPRGSRPDRPAQEFEPSLRIYVGNLPWQVDDARLKQVFSEHGKVLSASVVYDRDTRRSRGFGFVTMATQTELDDAIAALDGQTLDGRALKVNVAEEKPRRSF